MTPDRSETSLIVQPFSAANSLTRNLIKPIDKKLDLVFNKNIVKSDRPNVWKT
jgi:hypothetical protein